VNRLIAAVLLVVAAGALALRLPRLDERPLHTDESVHALKFKGLWETGTYRYDPHEYHGPSLYYLTWPLARAGGKVSFAELEARTLRLLPVIWGVGLILLLPLVADGQGRAGSIWAGVFTAVSPAMVFYSRYYIHEMGLVFFTMLLLAAGWRYCRTGHWGWALVGGLGLGLVAATKETFVLQLAAVAGALGALLLREKWTSDGRKGGCSRIDAPEGDQSAAAVPGEERSIWNGIRWRPVFGGLGFAALVWVVMFSSFFSNASGPMDSIRTYIPWFERAEGASPHIHPWYYYLDLLAYQRIGRGPTWSEGLILGLGLLGLVLGLTRWWRGQPGSKWLGFISVYTVLLGLIYSAIPYKTPWCLLGFWHGIILVAGAGAAGLVNCSRRMPVRVTVAGLLLVGTMQLTVQAYRASYTHCDNPRNPYVYAHTLRSALGLVDRVNALSAVDPSGRQLLIKVMARGGDYWPLPWYFRGFERVGWWGEVAEDPVAPVVIVSPAFASELEPILGETHQMAGYYGLRPSVFLQMYVERGLWERYLAAQDLEHAAQSGR
jgi:uncharacterized protein (TIGR03663 family)